MKLQTELKLRNMIRAFLKEETGNISPSGKYKFSDFQKNYIVTFKNNEEWLIVQPGMRQPNDRRKEDEITMRPYNSLAKERNTSLAIDFNLNYLNKNVKSIKPRD